LPAPHERAPEVLLCRQGVVRHAAQAEVRRDVRAAVRKGLDMVQLEPMGFSATLPALIDVRAPALVARENHTPHLRRHGAPALVHALRLRSRRWPLMRRFGTPALARV
jgi:hypothetical protein